MVDVLPGTVLDIDMQEFLSNVSPGASSTGAGQPLTHAALRKEFGRFAREELRDELTHLSTALRREIRAELSYLVTEARDVIHPQTLSLVSTVAAGTSQTLDTRLEVKECRTQESRFEIEECECRSGNDIGVDSPVSQPSPVNAPCVDGSPTRTPKSGVQPLNVKSAVSSRSIVTTSSSKKTDGTITRSQTAATEGDEAAHGLKLWRSQTHNKSLQMAPRHSKTKSRKARVTAVMKQLDLTDADDGGIISAQSWRRLVIGYTIADEWLDIIVAFAIVINAIFIGFQTDYQARHITDTVPSGYTTAEMLFGLFFLFELIWKWAKYRLRWFYMNGFAWNYFDCFLVVAQCIEVIGILTTDYESQAAQLDVGFLRLLRVLRLFRILRLVRLMQFIGELNMLVGSIVNSLKSLCWTVMLLMLMIYVVAIIVTQTVSNKRIEDKSQGITSSEPLQYWWSSLGRTVLSLYQAILGGADWDDCVRPLMEEVNWILGPAFMVYIAFALLAVMNVITGIFVESALRNAEKEKDIDFVALCRDVFDIDDEGSNDQGITWQEFYTQTSKPAFQAYMESVGIDIKDAKLLFRLLDRDGSGSLDFAELMSGMLRLRAGARFVDMAMLIDEVSRQGDKMSKMSRMLEQVVANRTGVSGFEV